MVANMSPSWPSITTATLLAVAAINLAVVSASSAEPPLVNSPEISTADRQEVTAYNAFKPGLRVREQPEASAPLVETIAYGERVTRIFLNNEPYHPVENEGMQGFWERIEHNGKKGYVVGIYLLDFPPPKPGTATMLEYFRQLAKPAGRSLEIARGFPGGDSEKHYTMRLFQNGNEHVSTGFYESSYETYRLPGVSIQQGYVIIRLIDEFRHAFGPSDAFPTRDRNIEVAEPKYTKQIVVNHGTFPLEGGISTNFLKPAPDPGSYDFRMSEDTGQLVITVGGGV